jgi:hypothetical protein
VDIYFRNAYVKVGEFCLSTNQGPSISFILSLIGGLIILVYSLFELTLFGIYGANFGGFGGFMGGMMGGYHDFMGIYGGSYEFFAVLSVVGLVCGILIVVGAVMLRARPSEHVMWGVVILAFSVISFVGMGGFFIGAILGIIGGAFALAYRPRTMGTERPSA